MVQLSQIKLILGIFATIILIINSASAAIINSVVVEELSPGDKGKITIEVKNILDDDIEDVSLSLDLKGLPFISIGGTEQFVKQIEEDEEENFVFIIKAAADSVAKDYNIPYTLKYTLNNQEKIKSGTIGITVKSQPSLVYILSTQNNILNRQGKLELKIVNNGFYPARFVLVKLIPSGFALLSEEEIYVGDVNANDFEAINFDVIFTSTNPAFNAAIEYFDFDNKKIRKTIIIPFNVYTEEKAKQLGLIKSNYATFYIILTIILILLFFVWRAIKKRRKLKKSMRFAT